MFYNVDSRAPRPHLRPIFRRSHDQNEATRPQVDQQVEGRSLSTTTSSLERSDRGVPLNQSEAGSQNNDLPGKTLGEYFMLLICYAKIYFLKLLNQLSNLRARIWYTKRVKNLTVFMDFLCSTYLRPQKGPFDQGILKGEVSLFSRPPVWLVWNQLYDNWQFLFLFLKQTNPQSNRGKGKLTWPFSAQCRWISAPCLLDLPINA